MKITKKYYSPTEVYFGLNSLKKIENLIGNKKKILIVTSKRGKKIFDTQINHKFKISNQIDYINQINSYPSTSKVDSLFKKFFKKKYNYVIGYGGGSVLDFAKIIKCFLSINKNIKIKNLILQIKDLEEKNKTKLLLIPTTSGTGSEVTSFATVWDIRNKKKLSLNSPILYSNYAIVDPLTTKDLSYENRLFTGLDAINQLFDSYWNKNSSYKSKILASKGIQLGIESILKLNQNSFDIKSRSKISEASLLSGFCISKTRTSICHSISYPLTSFYNVPHGLACFFTTLSVFEYININSTGIFDIMIKNTKYKNIQEIRSNLLKIYIKHGVTSKVKKYVGSFKNIKKLVKLMFTKGRSDNFCLPLSEKIVEEILLKSYRKTY